MNIAGILLAFLMLVSSALSGRTCHADGVCGDGAIDTPEQCDDGNLSNGDGCSALCTKEECGNGTVDDGEQCDDGSTVSGDGCDQACNIEFCGDFIVSLQAGEQCDDGNGLSGDGCSSLCNNEEQSQSSSSSSVFTSAGSSQASSVSSSAGSSVASSASSTSSSAPKEAPPPLSEETKTVAAPLQAKVSVVPQAIAAVKFLLSPESEEYRAYLSEEEEDELRQILQKIRNKKPLSDQEKIWARELLEILMSARAAERERYTDLLEQFIASPISAHVVREKGLSQELLIDVAVPIAIDELNQAIAIIQRGELKEAVLQGLEKLKHQGIDIEGNLPSDFESSLDEGSSPINVFSILKDIKEEVEKHATTDLPLSLEIIRMQVSILREAVPILQREYGLQPEELSALLSEIDTVSRSVSESSAYDVVRAINQFFVLLEERNVLRTTDLLAVDQSSHAAAHAARILGEAGESISVASDVRSIAIGVSSKAPSAYRDAFESGTLEDQRNALIRFLEEDERLASVFAMLDRDEREEFDERFQVLARNIQHVGITDDTASLCDDSMSDSLQCTAEYLSDLQEAARSRTVFSDFIGRLQDFFGIGL